VRQQNFLLHTYNLVGERQKGMAKHFSAKGEAAISGTLTVCLRCGLCYLAETSARRGWADGIDEWEDWTLFFSLPFMLSSFVVTRKNKVR